MAGQYPPQGPFPPQQPSGPGNPYGSPSYSAAPMGVGPAGLRERVQAKVIAPGVALIVVGVLGMLMTLISLVLAFQEPPPIDPETPEWIAEIRRGSYGLGAAMIQMIFLVANGLIITGGIMMTRFSSWGLALTASILAMLNFGNCCCLLGLPIGIWATVVLSSEDVKAAFRAGSRTGYYPPGGGSYPPGGPQQPTPPYGR